MYEMTGSSKHMGRNGENRRLPMSAMVQPYARSAVARRRKGRGTLGMRGLSIRASGGKQPLGAKPLDYMPIDSKRTQKWFQTGGGGMESKSGMMK